MSSVAQQDSLTYLQSVVPKIFNFDGSFEVSIFDDLTRCLYHSDGLEKELAKKVLEEFLADERSWCRVDAILEYSQSDESRFYALLILEKLVKSRWKLLPTEQRVGIRDYVVQQIIQVCSQPDAFETRKIYLNKLVSVLVHVLKFEWPRRWPEFIDEIVQSSKINNCICLINMRILRLLGEEVFTFASSQMNHIKTKYLRETLCSQFSPLFNHIYQILTESTDILLIVETLKTLNGFMPYIPHNFIFDSNIIDILLERLLKEPMFSNETLSCLSEIMLVDSPSHTKIKLSIYSKVLEKMKSILPYEFDFNLAFTNGTEVQQSFLRILSLFFSQSLRAYHELFAPNYDLPVLIDGLWYLISSTNIDDIEIFKICIEFWKSFTSSVRIDKSRSENRPDPTTRRLVEGLTPILSRLRFVVITHMKRPEEVIIYVDEHGEVVRQFMRDTDSINLYIACKDTLTNLTVLNPEEMKTIILERLDNEMNAPTFSPGNLNCLGWAVGSISGAMSVEMEREFLVRVLKNLLSLCDEKKGKSNKAIIASNIMYVVQQYPRFLKPYYRFLKTVLNKLFEFMTETFEGVQDMATDSFLKIAKPCKYQLAKVQHDEVRSFIEEALYILPQTISRLNIHQLETMFESFGYIISACDDSTQAQRLIIGCLDDHLTNWNQFNSNASTNSSECNNLESIQRLCVFLKISTAMCRSAGSAFDILISKIFQQLINLYSILSTIISQKVTSFGPDASLYSDVKILKGFKRDALNMLSCFIANCHENLDSITSRYFLPIVEVIFSEYAASPPVTRESEVLVLAAACINTLKSRLNEHIVHIFRHLFDSTLLMINQDHQEYPEHRIAFFKLIEAITTHCFQSLSTMSVAEFDFVMQSLFYAISHTMPSVTNVGLTILVTIFKNLVDPSSYSNSSFVTHFYKTYYISILDRIFHLVTDAMHSSDLAEHSFILSHMFNLLESNKIAIPIFEITGQYTDNISFVKDHSISFLKQQHDHLTEQQLRLFIDGLFCFHRNHDQFIQHLRDFLIALKEHQGQDTEDLFAEELINEMKEVKSKTTNDFITKSELRDTKNLQDYHTIS